MIKHICIGLLAHVDAGKTTLSEAMLYLSGQLRKLGRVDHRDSFLDNHGLERERGITIFSKQAELSIGDIGFTLLDTPGHVDFSAEAERTLSVLDAAVLVISGTDGVQAHTETLWKLLERHRLPVFIFVTKMDLPVCNKQAIMNQLGFKLSEGCVDFNLPQADRDEALAMCSEGLMEEYLEGGEISDSSVGRVIADRKVFPCFFGSGLKTQGVEELMHALEKYAEPCRGGEEFAARVFKISRDSQGKRLSFVKILSGQMQVRGTVKYKNDSGEELEEKITQLRIYSGAKFEAVETVGAGQICAVMGLSETYPGQGLGTAEPAQEASMEPVMSYRIITPKDCDPAQLLPKLMQLDQEDPLLHILWNEQLREISVQLMGRIQAEVFVRLVKERFDTDVRLDTGRIMYRETIADTVEGVGHFEPLRHYAEVHFLMEPLPQGSGLAIRTVCSEDELDRNWQRLILTNLAEKKHLGVLTGSPITDMRISLVSGRAHLKHTEGGDFRQAVYRAVRQGLMQAQSVLLEPWYSFTLETPTEQIGRAITDIRAMNGEFSSPEERNGMSRIEGSAPVSAMNGYAEELMGYTHGRGRLSFAPDGYRPCKNQEQIVREIGYDADRDEFNPSSSVFCAHGAGFNVPWDKVSEYMHLESCLRPKRDEQEIRRAAPRNINIDERELEAIMDREFGPIKRAQYSTRQVNAAPERSITINRKNKYIIVDGYNLIFAWDELKRLAEDKLDFARQRLMDMLSSYCGYTKAELVLVFDGFRTAGNPGSRERYHNINIAFTKENETADAFIESFVDEIGKNYDVRVVTSDNLIRLSALRSGVLRCSSKEFSAEVMTTLRQIEDVVKQSNAMPHLTKFEDGKRTD